MSSRPPVAILCGGRGTRLREHTEEIPKPLVEVGGHPILWHVMQIYLAQGFERFLLLTGYLGDRVREYSNSVAWPGDAEVTCLDTGLDTPTGGRVRHAGDHLDGERFCATYADGLADIDLAALLDHHAGGDTLATLTVVRPELQFGVADVDEEGCVRGFHEKPRSDHWVNGGFFCFEPGAVGYLAEDSVLEREPLERLARDGQLRAYRHEGFWECMDTYKDAVSLNDLWSHGGAPWKIW